MPQEAAAERRAASLRSIGVQQREAALGTAFAFSMVMHNRHAAVWIDHHDAKVFHVDDESFDVTTLHAPHRHVRRHPSTVEHEHPAEAQKYYHEVATSLEGVEEVLIVGPANAKLELMKHIHAHHHALVPKIVGIETVDHPTDGQLVAYVRRYFRAADRLR